MIQLANTTYQGRSVFSGTAAMGTAALRRHRRLRNGDAGRRDAASSTTGVSLKINLTGPDVFGTARRRHPADGRPVPGAGRLAAAVRPGDTTAMQRRQRQLRRGARPHGHRPDPHRRA